MFKSVRKNKQVQKISYVLILLFIVSQSLATDTGCKMEMTGHAMSSAHSISSSGGIDSTDPHAGHSMEMDMGANTHAVMSDCCDHDCQCAQHACSSSISIITHTTLSVFMSAKDTLLFSEDNPLQSLAFSALYRPPIFC
jgi:hypothetical protein